MSDIISLSINIHKMESMADRSLKLQIYTQELWDTEMTKLFSYLQRQCYMVVWETPILEMPKDLLKAIEAKPSKWDKTPSKRLRNVLFKIHEKDDLNMTFEAYYEMKMEQIIEFYKAKI
jgi:hypothetical protein